MLGYDLVLYQNNDSYTVIGRLYMTLTNHITGKLSISTLRISTDFDIALFLSLNIQMRVKGYMWGCVVKWFKVLATIVSRG